MEVFLKETSFHGVMLDELFTSSPEFKKKLHDIMTEGVAAGAVRPLPRTVFPTTEVEQAFRYSCHDGDKLVRELQTNMLLSPSTTVVIMPSDLLLVL
jgi:fatty acid synthase